MSCASSLPLAKRYPILLSARSCARLFPARPRSSIAFRRGHHDGHEDSADPLVRHLEESIRGIIVRRLAPDWLPFLPGASYWIPPSISSAGSIGIARMIDKLAHPLTDEESLSTTTVRGWPSSHYYVRDASPEMLEMVINSMEIEGEMIYSSDSQFDDGD